MLVVRPVTRRWRSMGIDLDAGTTTIAVIPSQLELEEPEGNDTGPA